MEQNKYEVLEEIAPDMEGAKVNVQPLKEYEKILKLEASRRANEQARKLIKLGCFEQKQETTVDYSRLEKQDGKKYKGLYQLYRNLDTMQLVFICPLVENNKGADDERTDMKPYAYDCLYIEQMDNETYQAVVKAAKNNFNNGMKTLFLVTTIAYLLMLVFSLVMFTLIASNANLVENSFVIACVYLGAMIAVTVCASPLLILSLFKYKKYKDQ